MSSQPRSLLQYLTQPNPRLDIPESVKQKRPGSSTRNRQYPFVHSCSVRKWPEFNMRTLRKMFGGDLHRMLEREMSGLQDFSSILSFLPSVRKEDSMTGILEKTTQLVVLEALRKTPRDFLGQRVQLLRGCDAILLFDDSRSFAPDWSGSNEFQQADNEELPWNILPGDTKTSWNWSTAFMEKRKYEQTSLKPIRQVAHYCLLASARYGFIVTDQELVPIRVGCKKPQENSVPGNKECADIVRDGVRIEYTSVRWDHPEGAGLPPSRKFTINLALYFLHILASNDGHLGTGDYTRLEDEVILPPDHQIRQFTKSFATTTDGSQREGDTVLPEPPDPDEAVQVDEIDGSTTEADDEDDEDQPISSQQNSMTMDDSFLLGRTRSKTRQAATTRRASRASRTRENRRSLRSQLRIDETREYNGVQKTPPRKSSTRRRNNVKK